MTPLRKNIAACLVLLLLFGGASQHLGNERTRMENKTLSLKHGALSSSQSSSRPKSTREKTVGDLLRDYSKPLSAQDLMSRLSLTENQRSSEWWKIFNLYLTRLDSLELAKLQVDLWNANGPDQIRMNLIHSIQSLQHERLKEQPAQFFEHVIEVGEANSRVQNFFTDWTQNDPQAALEWFRSKDPDTDFKNGSVYGGRNRKNLFDALLRGLVNSHWKSAVDLIRDENERSTLYEIPWILTSRLIESAVSEGDDSDLIHLLDSNKLNHLPMAIDPFSEHQFWTEFTKATGDLDRSVQLLKSSEKPYGYGDAIAQIIASQADLPIQAKADWIRSQIPNQDDYHQSLSRLLLNAPDEADPFGSSDSFDSGTKEWLLEKASTPENDPLFLQVASGLRHQGDWKNAYDVAVKVSPSPARNDKIQEIAEAWLYSNRDDATQVLPPEILNQIDKGKK